MYSPKKKRGRALIGLEAYGQQSILNPNIIRQHINHSIILPLSALYPL